MSCIVPRSLTTIFEENNVKNKIHRIKNLKDIFDLYLKYIKLSPINLLNIKNGTMSIYNEILHLHSSLTGCINEIFLDLKIHSSLSYMKSKPTIPCFLKFMGDSMKSFDLSLTMIEFKLLSIKIKKEKM